MTLIQRSSPTGTDVRREGEIFIGWFHCQAIQALKPRQRKSGRKQGELFDLQDANEGVTLHLLHLESSFLY